MNNFLDKLDHVLSTRNSIALMMNLNLGSCDLLLMFIVLVIVPVFLI